MSRLFFIALLGLAACTDAPTAGVEDPDPNTPDAPADPVLARLALSAPATVLDPGAAIALTVDGFDAGGAPVDVPAITWTSSAPAILAVTDGTVVAEAAGVATITASAGGVTGTIELAVRERIAAVARVAIAPVDWDVLPVGGTAQLAATAYDAAGHALPGRTITWASSDAAVATVAPDGQVVALAAGTLSISAACEGATATLPLRVQVPVATVAIDAGAALVLKRAETRQLAVTSYASTGEVLDGRAATWAVADPAIASISSSGVVTAHAVGATIATVTVEGATAQLALDVRAVARIQLAPVAPLITSGEPLQLEARLFDTQNRPIEDVVTWSSSAPAIATVDAAGIVLGRADGTVRITAASGDAQATVDLQVTSFHSRGLSSVNGGALPWTQFEDATTRTEVEGGFIALSPLQGRYELVLFVRTYVGGVRGLQTFQSSLGALIYDRSTQRLDFVPDDASAPFAGRRIGDAFEAVFQGATFRFAEN